VWGMAPPSDSSCRRTEAPNPRVVPYPQAVIGRRALAVLITVLVAAACRGGPIRLAAPTGDTPTPPTATPIPTPTASAPGALAPIAISGRSPFHGCAHQGQVSLDSEVEPSLAIDPEDPARLLVAWQQDRNFRGGALGILTATSTNGGSAWLTATPALTVCSGGRYDLASDPVVSIGSDRAYLAAIGIEATGSGNETSFDDEVVVSTSADGGRTWAKPVVVATSADPLISFDKETLVADPRAPGAAYASWVRYRQPSANKPPQANETFFARTTDGGVTWSAPTRVYAGGSETQFHQLVSLKDGVLLDAFIEAPTLSARPPLAARLAVVRSTDQGATWSPPVLAEEVSFTAVADPARKAQVRGTGQGVLAAAAPDGSVYLAWAEQHPGEGSFLAVARSQDEGRTWGRPVRVASGTSAQPFVPQVAVAGDGTVGVTWYQVIGDGVPGGALDTEAWAAWSTDRGSTWRTLRLAGPFDLHTADLTAGGDFLGDYEGLVGTPNGFAAAYAVAGTLSRAGPTDIVFSRVEVEPQAQPEITAESVLPARATASRS
jgi:BNR repeat-like domain